MSSKEVEFKSRQLKVAMYLLERLFGKKAAREILEFIEEKFCDSFVLSAKKRPSFLPPHIYVRERAEQSRREPRIPIEESIPMSIGSISDTAWSATWSGTTSRE